MKPGPTTIHYDNLLKDTIARATHELMNEDGVTWCLSVFEDNAGIIEFDERYGIAFKVETHNHPSAIEPYGGSATASAASSATSWLWPRRDTVANTDVFCVGMPDFPMDKLRRRAAPAARAQSVVPACATTATAWASRRSTARCTRPALLGNPLVFCGRVGLIPRDASPSGAARRPVVSRAAHRRDGILRDVQLGRTHRHARRRILACREIGNAITEKTCSTCRCSTRLPRRLPLQACTDCGAGGLMRRREMAQRPAP